MISAINPSSLEDDVNVDLDKTISPQSFMNRDSFKSQLEIANNKSQISLNNALNFSNDKKNLTLNKRPRIRPTTAKLDKTPKFHIDSKSRQTLVSIIR